MALRRRTQNSSAQHTGLLLIDKPQGYTSHDIVDVCRRSLDMKKVGHAGSLDPMATGLLILMLGKATSLFPLLSNSTKIYEGIIDLGISTDSCDMDGVVMTQETPPPISFEEISSMMQNYAGDLQQVTPKYSALKIGGKKACDLARKGIDFKPPTRLVRIKEFSCLRVYESHIWFRADVSAGTYIRSLAEDLGKKLGTVGTLSSLRRIASGSFNISSALTLDQLKTWDKSEIVQNVISIESPEIKSLSILRVAKI